MTVVCENNKIQMRKESDINSEIYFQSILKNDESHQTPCDSSHMAEKELILEYLQIWYVFVVAIAWS